MFSADLENESRIEDASNLLSQQVWCWGRDIVRPEGNWLLGLGFDRIEPPVERKGSSSLYVLELPRGRSIILRAFGVFYGNVRYGGVFLPRYRFRPQYSERSTLENPPWTDVDLPELNPPTLNHRFACLSLVLELVNWVRDYESDIIERLGVKYRQSTLLKWDNGKRPCVPAEEVVSAWGDLLLRLTAEAKPILKSAIS